MRRWFLIFGVVLIFISINPLFLMGREIYYENKVNREFQIDQISVNFMELGKVEILGKGAPIEVEGITVKNDLQRGKDSTQYTREYAWNGHTILTQDYFQPGIVDEEDYPLSKLKVVINGKDYSVENPIEIRPNYFDNNRYHGFFGVLRVKSEGNEELVLVQRVSGPEFKREQDLAWRTLRIQKDGQVTLDQFTYDERGDLPQRVNFVNQASTSPIALGYRSNILQGWPSLLFPLLYPFGTATFGLLFTLIGLLMRKKKGLA
ncbi:hypothetical protein [Ammoniphilus resinae]|uniref:DUF3068 domain-containing protein n=1 Tax=Ammoniphilus resinae TaxID=861532 RepID=A0ABS4GVJ4_9BACL|nr:hypothetical protein [Ammoniphilus resinae]MBP1934042.1 hypothetical protein [Ammoniphilus resinae]